VIWLHGQSAVTACARSSPGCEAWAAFLRVVLCVEGGEPKALASKTLLMCILFACCQPALYLP
jgi:hypothetical protein